jgi:hypothetical protein
MGVHARYGPSYALVVARMHPNEAIQRASCPSTCEEEEI